MIAKAIADKAAALTLGAVGTDIFVSALPPTPDACFAVYDTEGTEPDSYLPVRNPTFQILVRNTSYALGKAKIDAIREALHKLANFTSDSVYFYAVLATSDGGYIGKDENGRHEFSINFRCKTRVT
jgi:hypothetical protein